MSVPTPFCLVHNALTLSHSVAFNPDDIGVIDNPIADCIGQGRIIQIRMPARHIELGAKDGRGRFCAGFHQLQHIPRFAFFKWIQEPLGQDIFLSEVNLLSWFLVGISN